MEVVENVVPMSALNARQAGYRRDTITLSWEDRRKGHGRRISDLQHKFAISLPNGAVLKGGDCLVLDSSETVIVVQEAVESVYVIKPKNPQEWAYYAYQVGNRHQSIMIGESELICPQNAAVRSLLDQLHVSYTIDSRPFTAALAMVSHSHD